MQLSKHTINTVYWSMHDRMKCHILFLFLTFFLGVFDIFDILVLKQNLKKIILIYF